jgi:hypothetical protein
MRIVMKGCKDEDRRTSSGDAESKSSASNGQVQQAVARENGQRLKRAECERRGKALAMLARVSHRRELLEIEAMSDVRRARSAGATWSEIGAALRVSQQAASKTYGPLLGPQVQNAPVTRNRRESSLF